MRTFVLLIGARSFNRKSLHHIGESPNPYEQAISIIGKTLAAFDEDNMIPCFGFGDGTSQSFLLFFLSKDLCFIFLIYSINQVCSWLKR